MVDKIVNSTLKIKYLENILAAFSKLMNYVVVLSIVFFISKHISVLNFINQMFVESYQVLMIELYGCIAYSLQDELSPRDRFYTVIISLFSFSIMFEQFQASNLIFFVVWTIIVYELYKIISKIKLNILDKVTPAVKDQYLIYFHYLIIFVVTVFLALIISTNFISIISFAQNMIMSFLNYIPVYVFLILLMQILWSEGVHADQILGRFIDALLIIMILVNFENLIFEIDAPNIVNASFHLVFGLGTGSGMTLMLLLALKLLTKEDIKGLSQGSVFGINEPVIFGLPIAMNRRFTVPFIIAPLLSISFAWYMTYIGFAKVLVYPVSWATPPLLKSYLASGGHLPTVLVELLCYIIAFIAYAVFISLDKNKGGDLD